MINFPPKEGFQKNVPIVKLFLIPLNFHYKELLKLYIVYNEVSWSRMLWPTYSAYFIILAGI